jgi:Flp pilus assembly protein TadD
MLGSNLLETGQLAEAEHELLEAKRLDPNNSSTYMFLAGLRQMQGNLDAAIPLVERAIELDPNDALARNVLAELKAQRASHSPIQP